MTSYATSLMSSFRRIPLSAIPATLDCILASINSPPFIFSLLLEALPVLLQEVTHGNDGRLDDECCSYVASYVGALCHLLKKPGLNDEALEEFVGRVLIPVMRLKLTHGEIVDKVMGCFLDVVKERNAWGVVEGTMVPYVIKVMGMAESESESESSFPLVIGCHMLASTLDAVKGKVVSLIWDICNVTLQMLSHTPEHRSCAITILLAHILKTFVSENHCQKSRKSFFGKIWSCCKSLFEMGIGSSERRDAYTILSLCISYISNTDGLFDKDFWNEMKHGLVDKDSIVRKQSLHILKIVTTRSAGIQETSVVFETTLKSNGLTKRERWANKEAQSLGVEERLCNNNNSNNSNSNGNNSVDTSKWGAFFLLYEMLEEYGTHLVEAAWSYQMNLLLQTSHSSDNVVDPMETLQDMFDWLAVLWGRGLCHDNPQVRCLIMQSVLGIEWKKHGNYAKYVPRDFVLGSFIQGLNDPVHHKEFGLKGMYSSRTIDGATTFIQQYTACLSEGEQLQLLRDVASLVKTQSFGRAGLMSLAECIAAAAGGGGGRNGVIVMDATTSYNDKASLLDDFRFIIDTSKQHFNPSYRLKVCGKILDATILVMSSSDVPLESLVHFISSFPHDFLNHGGPLREKLQL